MLSRLNSLVRSALSTRNSVPIKLTDLRETDSSGDPGNVAAIGGVLAADTTPILRGDANESLEVHWAAGNSDIVAFHAELPENLDDTGDVLLELDVRTDNTGGGGIEAASFSVLSSWNGAAQVTDTATDSTPATTSHTITATIAAADVPSSARRATIQLVPGTHANDPIQLLGIRLRFRGKLLS